MAFSCQLFSQKIQSWMFDSVLNTTLFECETFKDNQRGNIWTYMKELRLLLLVLIFIYIFLPICPFLVTFYLFYLIYLAFFPFPYFFSITHFIFFIKYHFINSSYTLPVFCLTMCLAIYLCIHFN